MASKLDILINVVKRIGGIGETRTEIAGLGNAAAEAERKGKSKWKAFADGAKTAAGAIKGTATAVYDFSRKAALWIGGATASITALAIQSANFNKEIARASTMATTLGFRELRSEALKLAGDLGVAKSEIADGIYQALSAGIPEDNVFAFIRTAAQTAVADSSDVATAVDGITTVLNAFGLEAEKAGIVTDAMFHTVASGKTTFSELASSIAQAAPVAAALGVGYEQVLAAAASLTKQGIPTSQAMNQIRNSILILNGHLGDGWSKTQTFQEALENLAREGGHSAAHLEKIFGKENVAGVLALVGENAGKAKEAVESFVDIAGSRMAAVEKMEPHKIWDRAKESLVGLKQQIGNVFNNTLAPLVDNITKKFQEWRDNQGFWASLQGRLEQARETLANLIAAMNDAQTTRAIFIDLGKLVVEYFKLGAAEAVNIVASGLADAVTGAFKSFFSPDRWTLGLPGMETFKNWMVRTAGIESDAQPESPRGLIDTTAIRAAIEEQKKHISEAYVEIGKAIRESAREAAAEVDAAGGEIVAVFDSTKESLAEYVARVTAMEQALAAELSAGGAALAQAGTDARQKVKSAATGYAEATEEAAGQVEQATGEAATDIEAGAAIVTTAAAEGSGKVAESFSHMAGSIDHLATHTATSLSNLDRSLSAALEQIIRNIEHLSSRLRAAEIQAQNAAQDADTALAQLRNLS